MKCGTEDGSEANDFLGGKYGSGRPFAVKQPHVWLNQQSRKNGDELRIVPLRRMIVLEYPGFFGLLKRIQPDKPGRLRLDWACDKLGAATSKYVEQHKQSAGKYTVDPGM
jgi:hypothetical protein